MFQAAYGLGTLPDERGLRQTLSTACSSIAQYFYLANEADNQR